MAERLMTGGAAPDFTLQDSEGNEVSMAGFRGRNVVVYFYPAASTPGCTKEACDFRDSLVHLQQAGYDVVGISPDAPAKLARFVEQESLTYPLLSDPDKQVMDAYGAFGEKSLYGKKVTGVIRSTVVVGPDRKVELAKYNVKATGHVASLSKALGLAA
jgi:thioredoxin-dependent peroxiredoxin